MWDLTALLNAADPRAPQAERHTWLVRLMEWLRHAAPPQAGDAPPAEPRTPMAALRLRHFMNVLDRHPEHQAQVQVVLHAFWREVDAVALFADFGFAPRMALRSEVISRIRQRVLPRTPETNDLAELFPLLFDPADGVWLDALDAPLGPARRDARAAARGARLRRSLLDALTILVSGGAGHRPHRRAAQAHEPGAARGRALPQAQQRAAETLRVALTDGDPAGALAAGAVAARPAGQLRPGL